MKIGKLALAFCATALAAVTTPAMAMADTNSVAVAAAIPAAGAVDDSVTMLGYGAPTSAVGAVYTVNSDNISPAAITVPAVPDVFGYGADASVIKSSIDIDIAGDQGARAAPLLDAGPS